MNNAPRVEKGKCPCGPCTAFRMLSDIVNNDDEIERDKVVAVLDVLRSAAGEK